MADERISYEMLQDLLRSERRSNKLTPVATRFWHDVRDFLEVVLGHFRDEQGKDPFSRRVMLLTDEVKNARQAADSIWALRERKMALFALSQVREEKPKRPDGLTPDEEKIYDHLLAALKAGRAAVLEGARLPAPGTVPPPRAEQTPPAGDPPHGRTAKSAEKVEPPAPPSPAASASEGETGQEDVGEIPELEDDAESGQASPTSPSDAPKLVPADTPDEEMVTIRALGDIPAFVGPDMQTYLLKEGDVATVPQAIATLLERRNKAAVVAA